MWGLFVVFYKEIVLFFFFGHFFLPSKFICKISGARILPYFASAKDHLIINTLSLKLKKGENCEGTVCDSTDIATHLNYFGSYFEKSSAGIII